ncbi:MAG: nucleotide sugar dehydrogenase [Ilumatobacteraceae bacterium]
MDICVVALGKIGLPLAVQFARSGHQVIGADIDQRAVDLIEAGVAPFPGEENLDAYLAEVRAAGTLTATTDTVSAVAESEVVVIVVPLLVDRAGVPDFRAMDAATASVGAGLRPSTLVVYETTLPVGTTRQRFAPALMQATGYKLGDDLFVAFSPERVYSSRIFSDLSRYPKLVGGLEEASTAKAVAFYESVLQFDDRDDLFRPNGVWDLGTAEAAELAKLAETTYRDINIAYANELAKYSDAHGLDVLAVIGACNSQPYSHIHRPGVAVGGHCIPVYPRFYLMGDPTAALPAAARMVNESMPAYAVQRLIDSIGDISGKTVAVLGLAYRGGVKESAFSGAFGVVDALRGAGATALVHDPLYSEDEIRSHGFDTYSMGDRCDAAILQADHSEYQRLSRSMLGGAAVIVDGRNCLPASTDLTVISIGR